MPTFDRSWGTASEREVLPTFCCGLLYGEHGARGGFADESCPYCQLALFSTAAEPPFDVLEQSALISAASEPLFGPRLGVHVWRWRAAVQHNLLFSGCRAACVVHAPRKHGPKVITTSLRSWASSSISLSCCRAQLQIQRPTSSNSQTTLPSFRSNARSPTLAHSGPPRPSLASTRASCARWSIQSRCGARGVCLASSSDLNCLGSPCRQQVRVCRRGPLLSACSRCSVCSNRHCVPCKCWQCSVRQRWCSHRQLVQSLRPSLWRSRQRCRHRRRRRRQLLWPSLVLQPTLWFSRQPHQHRPHLTRGCAQGHQWSRWHRPQRRAWIQRPRQPRQKVQPRSR